jgi:hypothetical protein
MKTLKHLVRLLIFVGTGLSVIVLINLTVGVGRGQCPKCGYRGDLHKCKHCGWTACLSCWQRMSRHNTCPNCERAHP